MRLCFGTFGKILSCCKQKISECKLIARVAWVVDRMNSCLGAGLDYEICDDDLDTIIKLGNPPAVSKLLSCIHDLGLRSNKPPSLEVARERFKAKVMPFINDDKVAKAVSTILYIISQDKTIGMERKETFKRYLGLYKDDLLRQTKLNVPDFFTRILLYTTCIDNNEGRPYAKDINDTFIEVAFSNSWAELKWDSATQTVEIIPSEGKRILDEIKTLSEVRFSLMEDDIGHTDAGWLGIDENILFPNRCRHIKFEDPQVKIMAFNKLLQYMKLAHEFIDCLMAEQKSATDQAIRWPMFPSEKTHNIQQRLVTLSNELLILGMFPERLDSGQNLGASSLEIK